MAEEKGGLATAGCEALVDRVMRIVGSEQPGHHYLSHYVFARKVLREDCSTAMALARGYSHRPLTRVECHRLLDDWREFSQGAEK